MPPVNEKIEKIRTQRIKLAPKACRNDLMRCFAAKSSPRAAIKAFCLECVGYDRATVVECVAYACPLWEYRPSFKISGRDDGDDGT